MAGVDPSTRRRDRLKAGARRFARVPLAIRTSDLPMRAASAAVMLAITGAAFWVGGLALKALIALVAVVCFGEFAVLVVRATSKAPYRAVSFTAGLGYIGVAAYCLAALPPHSIIAVLGAVICVDVFAYFFGRTLGGPKIAPRISPSKTWTGLFGGMIGASVAWFLYGIYAPILCEALAVSEPLAANTVQFDGPCSFGRNPNLAIIALHAVVLGLITAPVAQAGDFFESWLKRRAHKKDSSNLIPGHGGVFDRVDGLLAVSFCVGLIGAFA